MSFTLFPLVKMRCINTGAQITEKLRGSFPLLSQHQMVIAYIFQVCFIICSTLLTTAFGNLKLSLENIDALYHNVITSMAFPCILLYGNILQLIDVLFNLKQTHRFLDCLVSNFGSLEELTPAACAPSATVRVAICGHTQEYLWSSCYPGQGFFSKNN